MYLFLYLKHRLRRIDSTGSSGSTAVAAAIGVSAATPGSSDWQKHLRISRSDNNGEMAASMLMVGEEGLVIVKILSFFGIFRKLLFLTYFLRLICFLN